MENETLIIIIKFIIVILIIKSDFKNIAPWYSSKSLDKRKINKINIEWMYYLNDSLDIRKLSIPGTHDSCASIFINSPIILWWIKTMYQCQSWSIEEQLFAGIRYFDLRPAGDGIIYHIYGKTKYSMNLIFEIFKNFLNEHPSEGLIVRLQFQEKNYGDNIDQSKEKEIYKVLDNYNDILYKDNDVPSVGKLRKKIFIILENLEYKNLLIWDKNDLMELQDYFRLVGDKKIEIEKKKNLVRRYMFNNNKDKLIINHCSSVGKRILTLNQDLAFIMNKVPYKEVGFRGILIFDFPGEELINHVINQNKEFFK